VDTIILSIGIIILGLKVAKYLIVPLLLYILDTIAFVIARILKLINTGSLKSPEQGRIQGKYRVYSPNPVKYILNCIPITPKELAYYLNNRDRTLPLENTLDVTFNPVVKNTDRSLFKFVHFKRIIERLNTKSK